MAEVNNNKDFEILAPEGVEALERKILDLLLSKNSRKAKVMLQSLHPADLADFINRVPDDIRLVIFSALNKKIDPYVLVDLESHIRENLFKNFGYKNSAEILTELDIDDIVHCLIDIDQDIFEHILDNFHSTLKKDLQELLSYPENSAGRLMQKKFLAIPEHWTVKKALDYMRNFKDLPSECYELFVIDPKYKPIGAVPLAKLIHSQGEKSINEIMDIKIRLIETTLDQEELAYLFKQYGLISVPIVNKFGRLMGVVTIHDVVDIIQKETEEDIMNLAGIQDAGLNRKIVDNARNRLPWLFLSLATSMISSVVIESFQYTLDRLLVLSSIMTVVASLGGNAGTQTMTVTVLALASKDIDRLNAFRVVIKQVLSGVLTGSVLAVFGAIILQLWHQKIGLSLVFAFSVILSFSLSGFYGAVIPILINKLKIDPSVASPVFLTTLTDITGFFTFLGLASMFLL